VSGPVTVTADLAVPRTVDFDLYMYDTSGKHIATSDQPGNGASEHFEVGVSAGRYDLRVYPYSGRDDQIPYRLRVSYP
jgi:hypothetical protein